jgi:hypothetical protein
MIWFYISFASEAGHLGSTVVEANDEDSALAIATKRGLNPGGEAMIVPVPAKFADKPGTVWMRYRLCSEAEMMAHGPVSHGRQKNATYVCELCNAGVSHTHH